MERFRFLNTFTFTFYIILLTSTLFTVANISIPTLQGLHGWPLILDLLGKGAPLQTPGVTSE